jgi:hypothetical protein
MLLLILLTNSISITLAQDSEGEDCTSQLIALSTNELDYIGNENASLLRTLRVIGIGPGEVNVTLFRADLFDNSSGKTFPASRIGIVEKNFTLTQNQEKIVNITLNTLEGDEGTYRGVMVVTAIDIDNAINATSLTIHVTANIQIEEKTGLCVEFLRYRSISLILVLMGIACAIEKLVVPMDKLRGHKETIKLFVVVIFGILVAFIYVTILVNAEFGDLSSAIYPAISTVIVAPFLGYVISYVNDQRKRWNEAIKNARETKNKGINKDIEIIRNLIGEFATHFASFKPNLFEEIIPSSNQTNTSSSTSEIVTSSEILYPEGGLLSKKVWEENRRQGMISNLPMLELEKYYGFIELYNRYYSCAIELTKGKKHEVKFTLSKDKKYVVDEITNDDTQSPILQFIKEFEKFRYDLAELETVLYVHLSYYLGLFSTSYLSPLRVEYPRVTRTLLYKLIDYKVLDSSNYLHKTDLTDDFDNEFKEIIKKWRLNAQQVRAIIKDIYHEDKIQLFLREVEPDFKTKYLQVKKSIGTLPSLHEKCVEKEKEKQITVKGSFTVDLENEENKENRKS